MDATDEETDTDRWTE